MELLIIRHAIAEPLGKRNEFSDEKRVLSTEGRSRMREVVKGLIKLGVEIDLILTSPLARALETAELIAASMGVSKKDIKQTENLAPGASSDQLFSEIKCHQGAESLALVGHQPDLGMLVSQMIQNESDAFSIQLKKGGICCVNVTETVPKLRGEIMWLLTPRQLRMLANA